MDTQELEEIVRTHQNEIFRYLRYLGADPAAAEDISQNTFLAVFEKGLPELDSDRQKAGWLRGVARHKFLDHCRKDSRSREVRVDSEYLENMESTWSETYMRDDEGDGYREAMRNCLEKLPEDHRKMVNMRYAEKISRDEMARLWQMTQNGIKSLLRRIRAALAECVEKSLRREAAGT